MLRRFKKIKKQNLYSELAKSINDATKDLTSQSKCCLDAEGKSIISELVSSEDNKKTTKKRGFFSLFSKLKNPAWDQIVQKGNYLENFVEIVESMSDEDFEYLFGVDSYKNSARTYILEKECLEKKCDCLEKCYCDSKIKNHFYSSEYTKFLKDRKLDTYDKEINHLRNLIKINEKGVPTQEYYTVTDFFKRTSLDLTKILSRQNSLDITDMKPVTDEIYQEQKIDKLLNDSELKTVDSLLKENEKYKSGNWQKEDFVKKQVKKITQFIKEGKITNKDFPKLIAQGLSPKILDIYFLEDEKEIAEKLKWDKQDYQNADYYSGIIKPLSEDELKELDKKPKITTEVLSSFWQELRQAREILEKFDTYYAEKQQQYYLITIKLNRYKKITDSSSFEDAQNLFDVTKKWLKAKRELAVLKKILKKSYQLFHKAEIQEISSEELLKQFGDYTKNQLNLFSLFDNIGPITKDFADKNKKKYLKNNSFNDFGKMNSAESNFTKDITLDKQQFEEQESAKQDLGEVEILKDRDNEYVTKVKLSNEYKSGDFTKKSF